MNLRSWQSVVVVLTVAWAVVGSGWSGAQVLRPDPPVPGEGPKEPVFDGKQPWFVDGDGPTTIVDPETDVPPWVRDRKPFQRWWYRYQLMNDPRNPLDLAALRLQAWKQLEAMIAGDSGAEHGAMGGAAAVPTWVNIGPAPTFNWSNTGQTVVGQVVDVAVHPTNSSRWLVAAADGGVWETTSTGLSWAAKTDNQATLSIGAVAYAPSNGNIIYAGTGNYTGFGGVGVLKSTDGAASWTLLGQATFTGTRFHDIRVHPSDPSTVVAANSAGVFRSTDGGTNWTNVRSGEATDLEVDPTNFSRQYAGIKEGNATDGVYRSTDGGASWTLLTSVPWGATQFNDVERIELAIAPSDVNVLYVAIGSGGDLEGLWRTTNAWAATPTWTQINTQATKVNGVVVPSYCSGQCWYDHELLVKPTNKDLLFAGGVNLFRYDATTSTWIDIGRQECTVASLPGCVRGIHADIHTMAWVGSRLIVGNDGGLFSTTDDGANWAPHNTGLAITEFYRGSLHPTNANIAQGGAQDNGSTRRPSTGGAYWSYADQASDGADNFFTNNNPDTRWALSQIRLLGLVRFKEPNGTQCNVHESIPDKVGVPWVAPVRLCPKNDDVVLAGTDNVWKTTQMFSATCNPQGNPPSPQWTKVCSGDADGGEYGAGVEAVAFAPGVSTCNTFAFGSNDGDLRITTNGGGATCTNLDPNNQVRNANVTDMALHPCFGESPSRATNTETMFITVGWYGGAHVYRTTDALSSRNWSDVTPTDGQGVPFDVPHESIVIDPLIPNHVYVGTDLGAWRSTDSGGTWQRVTITDGLPYVPIYDLQLNGKTDRLTAFSHGRSAYQATLNRCVGDCNGDGAVTIDELITITSIASGNEALCMCAIGDANRDGEITIDENLTAVNNALNGCPA